MEFPICIGVGPITKILPEGKTAACAECGNHLELGQVAHKIMGLKGMAFCSWECAFKFAKSQPSAAEAI